MTNPEHFIHEESILAPWQEEIGLAYSMLSRAQERLSFIDPGSEDEEEARMNVARRVGNLARVISAHQNYVGKVPDSIDITPPKVSNRRIYYFVADNQVRSVGLNKLRRPDFGHSEKIEPQIWTADFWITSALRINLMDLVPHEAKEEIMRSVAIKPNHSEN